MHAVNSQGVPTDAVGSHGNSPTVDCRGIIMGSSTGLLAESPMEEIPRDSAWKRGGTHGAP